MRYFIVSVEPVPPYETVATDFLVTVADRKSKMRRKLAVRTKEYTKDAVRNWMYPLLILLVTLPLVVSMDYKKRIFEVTECLYASNNQPAPKSLRKFVRKILDKTVQNVRRAKAEEAEEARRNQIVTDFLKRSGETSTHRY